MTLAVAGALAALAAGPSACRPTSCTLLGCTPVHARLTAYLDIAPATLAASRTTVCWRDVCADLVSMSDGGEPSAMAFDKRTSLLLGDVTVSPDGDAASRTRLLIDLQFFTRARSGDFVYTRQANGDRYRVTVVDPTGLVLFDAERSATYDEYFANGPDCDPEPCRRTQIDLSAP